MAATKSVLAEKGYKGFTIEEVAGRARASKPTIYRWWPDKARLVAELYELENKITFQSSSPAPVCEQYRQLLHDLWTLWETTVCGEALRCFIAESQLNKQNMKYMESDFMARRFEGPRQLLMKATEQGELPENTDIELLLKMSFGFCWFNLLTNQLDEKTQIDAFVEALFRL